MGLRKSIGKALLCTYQGKQQMHSSGKCTAAAARAAARAGRERALAVAVAGSCSANTTGFSLLELISKGVGGELSA